MMKYNLHGESQTPLYKIWAKHKNLGNTLLGYSLFKATYGNDVAAGLQLVLVDGVLTPHRLCDAKRLINKSKDRNLPAGVSRNSDRPGYMWRVKIKGELFRGRADTATAAGRERDICIIDNNAVAVMSLSYTL